MSSRELFVFVFFRVERCVCGVRIFGGRTVRSKMCVVYDCHDSVIYGVFGVNLSSKIYFSKLRFWLK